MSTRFYLPSTGAAPITPSDWEFADQINPVTLKAVRTKIGSAMQSKVEATGTVNPTMRAMFRWVAGPLSAQTISGTIKGQMRGMEDNAGANATLALAVKIIKPDGTDRAVLLVPTASDAASAPHELVTTLTNSQFKNAAESASISLSSGDAELGDFLVIEVGFRSATGTTRDITLSYGDDHATDLGENTTDVTAFSPWVEFSDQVQLATILFAYHPESPFIERLGFLTNILEAKDGTEQRSNLRKSPRQEFDFNLSLERHDRSVIDTLLYGALPGWPTSPLRIPFSIPLWAEPQYLTADAAIAATSVTLAAGDISYWAHRNGDSVLIWEEDDKYEVLENAVLSGTTLTFNSPLTQAFSAGAQVLALRTAIIPNDAKLRRYPLNLTDYQVTFRVLDNTFTLSAPADNDVYDTYADKIVLHGANYISGTLNDSLNQHLYISDGETGLVETRSFWDHSRRVSAKTFVTTSRAAAWDVRKFLYTVKGRQVSFLLPTFGYDLVASGSLVSTSDVLNIENVKYATLVASQSPRNVIRVHTSAGDVYTRYIVEAAEIDEDEEALRVDELWGVNVSQGDIERIEFAENVRIDSDTITIVHEDNNGTTRIGFPVRAVRDTTVSFLTDDLDVFLTDDSDVQLQEG